MSFEFMSLFSFDQQLNDLFVDSANVPLKLA